LHSRLKKMNKTHFGFYLIRFSSEKPVFLVALGPLSGEFWWKRTFLGSILVKVFYLYQGLCEYQKWDLSKTIFTLIPPKVTLKDPAFGPPSEFFIIFFSQVWHINELQKTVQLILISIWYPKRLSFNFLKVYGNKAMKIPIVWKSMTTGEIPKILLSVDKWTFFHSTNTTKFTVH